jgi:polar amino acid transport system substrate-binding protein
MRRVSDGRVVAISAGLCLAALVLIAVIARPLTGATPAAAQKSRIETVLGRGTLIAGIRRDNPPHSFIDGSGNWAGFDVDIAEKIASELGVKLQKVPVDEFTRISFLQTGGIDIAAASISHTRKREEQIDFSQTYFWSRQTFLVRKDRASSYADLVGKPVGVSRGSHSIGNWKTWLGEHGHEVRDDRILEFGSKQGAVQAVLQGVVAGWAEDQEVLISYARAQPDSTVLLDDSIGMKQDGIGLPKNDSKLRDAINRALQAIEKSGSYTTIYDRWFGPGTDTPIPLTDRIEVWPDG